MRESLPGAGAVKLTVRIQLRDRRRQSDRRPSSDVRSALSDRTRQARARRSGRLAQRPSPPRGIRVLADQGHADLAELSLVVAGGEDRRSVCREWRAARARRRRRGRLARRPGTRYPGLTRADAADSAGRGLRAHVHGRLPQAGDSRCFLQRSLRDGDLCLPRRQITRPVLRCMTASAGPHPTTVPDRNGHNRRSAARRFAIGLGRQRLRRRLTRNENDALRHHRAHRLRAHRDGA